MKAFVWFIINFRTDFWLFVFRCFTRIHDNRIIFWSTGGRQYSCNPKYLTEYLVGHHPGEFDIYWAFAPQMMRTSIPAGVNKVMLYRWSHYVPSVRFLFVLSSAHFIVTNFRQHGGNGLRGKRKGQLFIQTWHASWGVKPIEADVNYKEAEFRLQRQENEMTNLMLSSCPARTLEIRRAQGYKGEVLESGTPRVDLFFSSTEHLNQLNEKVHEFFKIPNDIKIVLYAPTFRDGDIRNMDIFRVDWDKIINALNAKFGGKHCVLLRLHSILEKYITDLQSILNHPDVINATSYDDIQELLVATDVLITDYSSSPFDYCYLERPCFLFCTDYNEYIVRDRSQLKFNIKELPFPYSENEDELCTSILNFDEGKYNTFLKKYLTETMQTYEHGHASEDVYHWLHEHTPFRIRHTL